jgi:phosphoribosylpyrophosphate synthetase
MRESINTLWTVRNGYHPLRGQSEKIKVISIADLFADVINKVYKYKSISSNFLE